MWVSQLGCIMAISKVAKGMPPAWGPWVTMDDVDKLASRVEKLGGKILDQPRDIPKLGRFMVIQDPQGANLSLIS